MDLLDVYEFPGNVRQLEHLVMSALAHVDAGSVILPRHLPKEIVAPNTNGCDAKDITIKIPGDLDYKGATTFACRQIDALYLPRLLHKHQGNQSQAAAEAGIDRKTLAARIREIFGEEGA